MKTSARRKCVDFNFRTNAVHLCVSLIFGWFAYVPDVLNTVEWHSPSFTPDSIDYCYVGCGIPSEELGDDHDHVEGYVYYQRSNMYDVGGIPHLQWNGINSIVGAGAPWTDRYEDYYR